MAYSVAIVVTPDIGEELTPLANRLHVWLAATVSNLATAEAYRRGHPQSTIEKGVTTFSIGPADTAEDQVLDVLANVDLHHGEHSHIPPWDSLEIYGASPTPALRAALGEFGVSNVETTPMGFRCSRRRGAA